MIFSLSKSLEDRVVELLLHDRVSLDSLHAKLREERVVSLRGVYKAVDKLLRAKVLLKVGKRVMLDQEWVLRVTSELGSLSTPQLAEGERAVYTFTSIEHLDTFWKTTVLPLERSNPTREVFFYNPHNFWAYLPARKESEDAYYRHFSDNKLGGFFTVGGESKADAEFKRKYQDEYFQVDLRPISNMRRTDHVTLLSSYIITVRFSRRVAEQIDHLYESGENIDQLTQKINRICEKCGKIRFTIENDILKANALRKSLSRNFYFKPVS